MNTAEMVAKIQAVIDSGKSMTLGSTCKVWSGKDGRVRVYWGGEAYVEIMNGEISTYDIPRKAIERRVKAIEQALGL